MKRTLVLTSLIAAGLLAILFGPASAQRGDELEQLSSRFTANNERLAEPFKGLTTNGEVERGLFAVRSTGVSTEPVRRAAVAFLAGLTAAQRARTLFASADDIEWRKWANQDLYRRQGVSLLEMTDAQRELAIDLLRAGLSAKGLQQTRDIMRLNHTLAELNDNNLDRFGEWRYYITVMGEPSATEPWGWQFDGHHAAINYFVLGDQVVMTPFFAGSEPVIARAGKYAGTTILQAEQDQGLALINALPEAQRNKAILRGEKTTGLGLTEAFRDNVVLDYQGVRVTELPAAQRKQLVDLIALHVSAMDEGHARVKMEEILKHLDRTTFAWIGQRQPDSVFYYRIHSPVILIEFDHQPPFALRKPGGPAGPQRDHIHVIVRTPNGNDYGKDLLREHYARHPHN